ncbi:MAG TPA: SpoIIE family protein phosphatase [Acidobacteriota bacterium]|jgi:sigma-B regulation protein RsbU (phosphoserine phosphatase)
MKRIHILYACLAAVFVVAALYQTRLTIDVARHLLDPSAFPRMPFALEPMGGTVARITPEGKAGGLQKNDVIVTINGRNLTGYSALADALTPARPGERLQLEVRRRAPDGQWIQKSVAFSLVPPDRAPRSWTANAVTVVLAIVMPWFCLALGFWVVLVRPRDPLAWIVLGLMISFGQIGTEMLNPRVTGITRELALAYHKVFGSAWPLWMLLFGLYFPERLIFDRRWPWVKWILIAPLIFFIIADVVITIVSTESFSAAAPISRVIDPYSRLGFIIGLVSVGCFFASLHTKVGMASTPDGCRRLKVLLMGTHFSLAPMFVLVMWGLFRNAGPGEGVPPWIFIFALLFFSIFPLTLAYVIVVQRALDVRMVLRQGVRYAIAKGGVRLLRIGASVAVAAAIISLVQSNANWAAKIAVIGAGWGLITVTREGAERLAIWTDRRFFREAYNAEQILSDLGEKVRTIVETGPLLETVAARISESLHVPQIAMILRQGDEYRPAHALGYSGGFDINEARFAEQGGTVRFLRETRQPARVYFDDPASWVFKQPGMDGERAKLQALGCQLLLPLSVKEELLGFVSLGAKQSEEPYSSSDARLLRSVATQTGLALENSRLTEAIAAEVAQRERINRELEIAREVQERLFPQELEAFPGLDYYGACRPVFGVGGDYYDFLGLADGNVGIAIGDVSGKGISAALLMASLQASLRGQTMAGVSDLAKLMANVNRLVYNTSASNRYATFFYAQYQPSTGTLAYVNAGHNSPILLRPFGKGWEVIRLEVGGPVVGLLPNAPYQQGVEVLRQRDTLLAFTDGISEAMNVAGEEWGEERMISAAQGCADLSAKQIVRRLMVAADQFAGAATQHDDMTAVVLRIL